MGLKLIKEVGKKNCDLTGEKRSYSTFSSLFQLQFSVVTQQVGWEQYNNRKLEEIYNLYQ